MTKKYSDDPDKNDLVLALKRNDLYIQMWLDTLESFKNELLEHRADVTSILDKYK